MGRSWMAGLALVAGLVAPAIADDNGKTIPPSNPSRTVPPPAGSGQKVCLELKIAGLSAKGCEVEIKPAHAGCTFRPVVEHVKWQGERDVVLDDVISRSADRDCTFAITIREPGQPERTTFRGLQLKPKGPTAQRMQVFLSSPSKLARAGQAESTKR